MHSQSLSGTMLLLVHLLLFSICLISSAVPIDVSNQPYTNVNTEEVTDYSLQHINKASEPISRTESTHPAEHTNTESTSIKTHHAQQEALASDIKNFVPDTKTGKGNQEDRIASMQNRDHGSEIYARAEHPEDPVGNELKEYGANSDAASPFKKVQSNKVDLPEQINRKVKAALVSLLEATSLISNCKLVLTQPLYVLPRHWVAKRRQSETSVNLLRPPSSSGCCVNVRKNS